MRKSSKTPLKERSTYRSREQRAVSDAREDKIDRQMANLPKGSAINLQTGQIRSSNGQKTTSTISVSDDLQAPAVDFPTVPVDTRDYMGVINGIQAGTGSLAEIATMQNQQAVQTQNDLQKMYADLFNERPDQGAIYNEALADSGKLEAQREFSNRKAELDSIVARGTANQLAVVGQGRGVPEAIIGGQQAQIARETAIQALPVSAQVAAAQGNLEMANENLNTLFSIKSADAQAEFQFKTKIVDSMANFATEQQKTQLEFVMKAEQRRYEETQQLTGLAQGYAQQAFANGQSKLGADISRLDIKDPEFKDKLATLQSQLKDPMRDLEMSIKKAQLADINEGRNARKADQEAKRIALEQAKNNGQITQEQAKVATDLRKEYNMLEGVKSLNKSETDTKAIVSALASGKPTDDIAAINSFQRIAVDPGVSVREGDVALLQSAVRFGDKAWLKTEGYLKGNKLTPEARKDMQSLALRIHDARVTSVVDQTAPIKATADIYGIPYEQFVASPMRTSNDILAEIEQVNLPPEVKSQQYVGSLLQTLAPTIERGNPIGNSSFSDLFKTQ